MKRNKQNPLEFTIILFIGLRCFLLVTNSNSIQFFLCQNNNLNNKFAYTLSIIAVFVYFGE